jgi:hypothetical protein
MAKVAPLPLSLPPRGLSRVMAAYYLNLSPGKFDQLVADGRMPPPKRVDGRKIWDRLAIDAAFDSLPDDGETLDNPWDSVL